MLVVICGGMLLLDKQLTEVGVNPMLLFCREKLRQLVLRLPGTVRETAGR